MASTNTVVKGSVVSKDKSTAPSSDVWFCMKFRTLAEICLLMPLLGLAACLIVALLFQFEHIQETACKVILKIINFSIRIIFTLFLDRRLKIADA